jgi:hypothetical protein
MASDSLVSLHDEYKRQVPLCGIKVKGTVFDTFSVIALRYTFLNLSELWIALLYSYSPFVEDEPIEAKLKVQTDLKMTICGLEIRINDKTLHGRIEEKEKAFQDYDDSIASGRSSFLMEYDYSSSSHIVRRKTSFLRLNL